MENLYKLGKTSEIIGKFLFYSITVFLSIALVVISISKIQGNDVFNFDNLEKPGVLGIIGIITGNLILGLIAYFIIRSIFRPIYNLNKNIRLKTSNQLTEREFKTKWNVSLICSLIFGLSFAFAFGISLLLMIPHYILLIKSRVNAQTREVSIQPNSKIKSDLFSNVNFLSRIYDLKGVTEKEAVVISLGVGLVISIIMGSLFCRTKYYRLYKGNSVEVSEEMSKFKLCEFNYLLAICCFVLAAGICYMFLKDKTNKLSENYNRS